MRVALSATAGIFSALAPLLFKETVVLLSEYRQASERLTSPIVTCPEPEVADLDGEAEVAVRVSVHLWLGYRLTRCAYPYGDPSLLVLLPEPAGPAQSQRRCQN